MGYVSNAQLEFLFPVGNGEYSPRGETAREMSRINFDPGLKRPWISPRDGNVYCDVRTGRMVMNSVNKEVQRLEPEVKAVPLRQLVYEGLCPPIYNATALTKDAWYQIDQRVLTAAHKPQQAWADLQAHSTYGGFDAMTTYGLMRSRVTASGNVTLSMQVGTDTRQDRQLFDQDILPLPIVQTGFEFDQRELMVARNSGQPLDNMQASEAGRSIGEYIEQMTIGTIDLSSLTIGASADFTRRGIYGYRTCGRITKTDVTATASFVAATFLSDVLAMIELARAQNLFGPFTLYYSTTWDQYLERDYWTYVTSGGAAPTKSVVGRVQELKKIKEVKPLQFFTNTDELLLVQWDETLEAINGMEITTVQWESQGGAQTHFRVMAIKLPAIRERYIGTSTSTKYASVVHGTTS